MRQALNALIKASLEMETGMDMDLQMDGSGECGHMIHESWFFWYMNKLQEICKTYNTTLKEMYETAHKWAHVELEKGPKKYWCYFEKKSDGCYMSMNYMDTKWGPIAMELEQYGVLQDKHSSCTMTKEDVELALNCFLSNRIDDEVIQNAIKFLKDESDFIGKLKKECKIRRWTYSRQLQEWSDSYTDLQYTRSQQ